MLKRWHRKIGSWLGLLAILLATLAPTVSQTLAAHGAHGAPGAQGAMADGHCQMASMDGMDAMDDAGADSMPGMSMPPTEYTDTADTARAVATTPDDPTHPPGKHAQLPNGDVCGYCSLLAHLPTMPGVETLFVVAVHAREQIVATRFDSVRRVEPPSFAQPRAPPSAS
ncbi:DUF2946 family protein [Paraburkholderia antibiotica]|uniref:DUF2946 domain-containing protein n=1 Tax=Paraburkholderia antibiotica TaxID=2728839 RepID=A0A7X9X4A1_9BURK|nr:DUF2946 family protein [Paraburkholderia antibiotica]NML31157.1 DUF2946 domain-containing protein [Paraburkholderia antibiotica]